MSRITMKMSGLQVYGRITRLPIQVILVISCLSVLCPSPVGAQEWNIVEAQTLHEMMEKEPITLVNVMSRIECLDHRIPGSRCIACEEVTDRLPEIPRDRKLVLYCESEGCIRSCTAAQDAITGGIENVYVLKGGMPAWKRAGFVLESVDRVPRAFIHSIKAEGLEEWLSLHPDYIVLDIRSEALYEEGHLEGAVNVPFHQLHERYYELPWDRALFVVDERGVRSFLAACYLARKGFPVVRLFGGMEKWRAFSQSGGQNK